MAFQTTQVRKGSFDGPDAVMRELHGDLTGSRD